MDLDKFVIKKVESVRVVYTDNDRALRWFSEHDLSAYGRDHYYAVCCAKSALEKQIPEQPYKDTESSFYQCPACRTRLYDILLRDKKYLYCHYCGQRIKPYEA